MTPKQIYDLPPIKTTNDIFFLEKHFNDIDFPSIEQADGPIEIKYYAEYSSDGERCWELFSLWLDDKPFMICQEAGRGGRDHINNFITDKEVYLKAVEELRKLSKIQDVDVFSEDKEIPELTEFYNGKLEYFYSKDINPKYKVDDVVEIMDYEVPHGYQKNRPKIKLRVKIYHIDKFSPFETYRGIQLDRKFDNGEVVISVGNGEIHCRFCDEDVLS